MCAAGLLLATSVQTICPGCFNITRPCGSGFPAGANPAPSQSPAISLWGQNKWPELARQLDNTTHGTRKLHAEAPYSSASAGLTNCSPVDMLAEKSPGSPNR